MQSFIFQLFNYQGVHVIYLGYKVVYLIFYHLYFNYT